MGRQKLLEEGDHKLKDSGNRINKECKVFYLLLIVLIISIVYKAIR